jgi:hypothetical protein
MKPDSRSRCAGHPYAKGVAALLAAICLCLPLAAPAAQPDATTIAWADGMSNLTAQEALTLFSMSRDLFPHAGMADSTYMACIDPIDAAASDPQEKAAIDNAMGLIAGAMRRMGYETYSDIADDDERVRMSKMLTEGRWLRQFRLGVERCLAAQSERS